MTIHNPLVMASGQIRALPAGDTINTIGALAARYNFVATNNNGGTINKCQAVYIDANDSVKLAISNNSYYHKFAGLVSDDSSGNGNTVNIQYASSLTATTAQWDVATGCSGGLIPGSIYYLSDSVAGKISTTPPTTNGKYVMPIGIAFDTTEMEIFSARSILLVDVSSPTAFPEWEVNEENWATIATAITERLANYTETQNISSFEETEGGWHGGVLAPNGFIYGIPNNLDHVLKIDPSDNSTSKFGSFGVGADNWSGGVLAPNDCIYCMPSYSANVLKIDTSDDSTSLVGSLGGAIGKWCGGILAQNGCIYGIPNCGTSVLKVDPATDNVTTFGSLAVANYKWFGGALASNGCIYVPPTTVTEILKINTNNDTVTTFGSFITASKWAGAVTAPNGLIYCVPFQGDEVLVIDPSDDSTSLFSFTPDNTNAIEWLGGTLAPNGHVYCFPYGAATILDIDTDTDTATTYGSLGAADNKGWGGGILATTGVIYRCPNAIVTVYTIDTGNTVEPDFALSRFFNKF